MRARVFLLCCCGGDPLDLIEDELLEISDLIVRHDSETLERLPVRRSEVVDYYRERGQSRALRILESIPGPVVFEESAVDDILVRAHAELQRLHEEFLHGHRVLELLGPIFCALEAAQIPKPWRIVDIGCGLGYTIRWLANQKDLPRGVELVGVDYNSALIAHASAWAMAEQLRCEFHVANAFTLKDPATVFMSTGVLHHFRGADLSAFFKQQATPGTAAFLHFDIRPTWLAPLGAWIFHQARMRVPLARHDGVLSALRAHPGAVVLDAARGTLPVTLFDAQAGLLPMLRIFQTAVGLREELRAPFQVALGSNVSRLGEWG